MKEKVVRIADFDLIDLTLPTAGLHASQNVRSDQLHLAGDVPLVCEPSRYWALVLCFSQLAQWQSSMWAFQYWDYCDMKLSANGSCTANEVSKAMAARHDIVKLKCSRTLQGGGYHSGPLKIRLVQRKQVTSKSKNVRNSGHQRPRDQYVDSKWSDQTQARHQSSQNRALQRVVVTSPHCALKLWNILPSVSPRFILANTKKIYLSISSATPPSWMDWKPYLYRSLSDIASVHSISVSTDQLHLTCCVALALLWATKGDIEHSFCALQL